MNNLFICSQIYFKKYDTLYIYETYLPNHCVVFVLSGSQYFISSFPLFFDALVYYMFEIVFIGSYSMQIAASIIFAAIENNYTFQHIFVQRQRQIYAANDLTWRFYTG